MRNMIPYQSYFSFENELDTNTTALEGSLFLQTSDKILHVVTVLSAHANTQSLHTVGSIRVHHKNWSTEVCLTSSSQRVDIKDVLPHHQLRLQQDVSGKTLSSFCRHLYLPIHEDHHFQTKPRKLQ